MNKKNSGVSIVIILVILIFGIFGLKYVLDKFLLPEDIEEDE